MVILSVIVGIVVLALVVLSFFQRAKLPVILLNLGNSLLLLGWFVLMMLQIPKMSDDMVSLFNGTLGYFTIAGFVVFVLFAAIGAFVKKKFHESVKPAFFAWISTLGVILMVTTQILTMYSYVELTKREEIEETYIYEETECCQNM